MFIALSRAIDTLNEKIAGAVSWALLLAVIICAVNALVRYTFMLASAYTLRRDEHVRIDVITGHFSKRTQVWIDLAGYVLFLLPVCLLIFYYGVPFFRYSLLTGESSSSAGGLIVWPAKLLVPVGFFLLLLQGISEIIKRIAYLTGRSDGSDFAKHATTPQDEIAAIKEANQIG
jgi:TRAP-type mannitol/chloroaromatic compound transport system permease small subunit